MIIQICCINRLSFHPDIHLSISLQQRSRYIICFTIKFSLTAYGFNMSSEGFNVCKFYVPRGSICIFPCFFLFFILFSLKRRIFSKKARLFKTPRNTKMPQKNETEDYTPVSFLSIFLSSCSTSRTILICCRILHPYLLRFCILMFCTILNLSSTIS